MSSSTGSVRVVSQVGLGWDLRRRNIEADDDDYDNPYEQLRLLKP